MEGPKRRRRVKDGVLTTEPVPEPAPDAKPKRTRKPATKKEPVVVRVKKGRARDVLIAPESEIKIKKSRVRATTIVKPKQIQSVVVNVPQPEAPRRRRAPRKPRQPPEPQVRERPIQVPQMLTTREIIREPARQIEPFTGVGRTLQPPQPAVAPPRVEVQQPDLTAQFQALLRSQENIQRQLEQEARERQQARKDFRSMEPNFSVPRSTPAAMTQGENAPLEPQRVREEKAEAPNRPPAQAPPSLDLLGSNQQQSLFGDIPFTAQNVEENRAVVNTGDPRQRVQEQPPEIPRGDGAGPSQGAAPSQAVEGEVGDAQKQPKKKVVNKYQELSALRKEFEEQGVLQAYLDKHPTGPGRNTIGRKIISNRGGLKGIGKTAREGTGKLGDAIDEMERDTGLTFEEIIRRIRSLEDFPPKPAQ